MPRAPFHFNWFTLELLSGLYLAPPVLIFLFFWFNPPYNILFVILATAGVWQCLSYKKNNNQEHFYSIRALFWLAVFCGLYAFLMGAGGWTQQINDYHKTNCFLEGATPAHWPWMYQFADGQLINIVYYLGYHLVPAFFGSLYGRGAVDIVSFLGATAGLWLGLIALGKYFKLPSWVVPLVLGFGGLNMVGGALFPFNELLRGSNFSLWMPGDWALPLRSFTPGLTFRLTAFHLITPLLLLPLTLKALDERRYSLSLMWICLGLFWSPLTTFAPVLFWLLELRKARLTEWLNVKTEAIVLGVLTPIVVFYSTRLFPEQLVFLGTMDVFWSRFPTFVFINWLVWFLFIRVSCWKDPRVWVLCLSYVILCFWTLGDALDLLFRCGLGLIIFLFGLIAQSICETREKFKLITVLVVYCISAAPEARDIYNRVTNHYGPAFYPQCRADTSSFIQKMGNTERQFLGDQERNILSNILLKKASHPIPISESWLEASTRRAIAGEDGFKDDNRADSCRLHDTASYFMLNPNKPGKAALAFHVENTSKMPLAISVAMEKYPLMPERMCWLAERIAKGTGRATTYTFEYEYQKKICIPPGGTDILLKFWLKLGINRIVFFREKAPAHSATQPLNSIQLQKMRFFRGDRVNSIPQNQTQITFP